MKKLTEIDKIFESDIREISNEETAPIATNGKDDKSTNKMPKFKKGQQVIYNPKEPNPITKSMLGEYVTITGMANSDEEPIYNIQIGSFQAKAKESDLMLPEKENKVQSNQSSNQTKMFGVFDRVEIKDDSPNKEQAYKDGGNGKGVIKSVNTKEDKYTVLWDNDVEFNHNGSELEKQLSKTEKADQAKTLNQEEYKREWEENFSKHYDTNFSKILQKGDIVYIHSGKNCQKYGYWDKEKPTVNFVIKDIIYNKPPIPPRYILARLDDENEIVEENHATISKVKSEEPKPVKVQPEPVKEPPKAQPEPVKPSKFKRGEKVMFEPMSTRKYWEVHKGPAEIVAFYGKMEGGKESGEEGYSIKTKNGITIPAYHSELTPVKKSDSKTAEYIEKQFQIEEFAPGDRVIVNGKEEGKIEYADRKGTVKKVSKDNLLIEFDDDPSKNIDKETMLVDITFAKKLEEPNVGIPFKKGDQVTIIDNKSVYYGQSGTIETVWDPNEGESPSYQVMFANLHNIYFEHDQLKFVSHGKSTSFKSEPSKTTPVSKGVDYAEEEDEEISVTAAEPLKKEDLLESSYKDYINESKTTTKEDLVKIKSKYEEIMKNAESPKIQKLFAERTLKTLEIIESYFDFLTAKVADGLPVLRTVESIEDEEMIKNKTKVRASDSKEMTRKYSFDQGIIVYWKFKDAVVFKTI